VVSQLSSGQNGKLRRVLVHLSFELDFASIRPAAAVRKPEHCVNCILAGRRNGWDEVDDDDDDEGRINFSVALSPKTTRTRNNKPKQ